MCERGLKRQASRTNFSLSPSMPCFPQTQRGNNENNVSHPSVFYPTIFKSRCKIPNPLARSVFACCYFAIRLLPFIAHRAYDCGPWHRACLTVHIHCIGEIWHHYVFLCIFSITINWVSFVSVTSFLFSSTAGGENAIARCTGWVCDGVICI